MGFKEFAEFSLPGAPNAAVSAQNSAAVDVQAAEGVVFLATIGAGTTGATLTAQTAAATSGPWVAVSGGVVTFDTASRLGVLDVVNPKRRYVRAVFASSANSDYSGAIAFRYGLGALPSTAGSNVITPVQAVAAT